MILPDLTNLILAFHTFLYLISSVYLLFIFYLAIMNLRGARNSGKLTKTALRISLPIAICGYSLDFFCNMIPFTIMFLEFPQEYLVTDRLSRHTHDADGWRKSLALWFGANLLDPFDPTGKHLK